VASVEVGRGGRGNERAAPDQGAPRPEVKERTGRRPRDCNLGGVRAPLLCLLLLAGLAVPGLVERLRPRTAAQWIDELRDGALDREARRQALEAVLAAGAAADPAAASDLALAGAAAAIELGRREAAGRELARLAGMQPSPERLARATFGVAWLGDLLAALLAGGPDARARLERAALGARLAGATLGRELAEQALAR
jgi:hypothetical protein